MNARSTFLSGLLVAILLAWFPTNLGAQENLGIHDFRVGAKGYPAGHVNSTDVKILQIIDESKMLVLLRDQRDFKSTLTIMLKHPTKGLVDGKFFVWQDLIGEDCMLSVSDTVTYKTAGNASKTVFLVDVIKLDEKQLEARRLMYESLRKSEALAEARKAVIEFQQAIKATQDQIRKHQDSLASIPKQTPPKERQRTEIREKNAVKNQKDQIVVLEKKLAEAQRRLVELEKRNDQKKEPTNVPKGKNADTASQFVGRWRIVDDKGVTACYFTLTGDFAAKKSHAPDVTAKWEVVGTEARITWSDGWKDILRPEKGRVLKIAFGPGAIRVRQNWIDDIYVEDVPKTDLQVPVHRIDLNGLPWLNSLSLREAHRHSPADNWPLHDQL